VVHVVIFISHPSAGRSGLVVTCLTASGCVYHDSHCDIQLGRLLHTIIAVHRAITTFFCFTYTIEGVTAMPRGLHAGLYHAFLVTIIIILKIVFDPFGRSSRGWVKNYE